MDDNDIARAIVADFEARWAEQLKVMDETRQLAKDAVAKMGAANQELHALLAQPAGRG